MSFWQKHGPPILHNAGGTLLASAITGGALLLVGILKPSLLVLSIPVWVCLLFVLVVCSVCWFMLRKLNRQLRDAKLLADLERIGKTTDKIATKLLGPLQKAIERGELDDMSIKMLNMIANANPSIT